MSQTMREGFVVLDKPCEECLFSPDRIVSGKRAAEVIADCAKGGTYFECHKGSIANVSVCCRGYYDRFPLSTSGMRISHHFGIDRITTVDKIEAYSKNAIDYQTLIGPPCRIIPEEKREGPRTRLRKKIVPPSRT